MGLIKAYYGNLCYIVQNLLHYKKNTITNENFSTVNDRVIVIPIYVCCNMDINYYIYLYCLASCH